MIISAASVTKAFEQLAKEDAAAKSLLSQFRRLTDEQRVRFYELASAKFDAR